MRQDNKRDIFEVLDLLAKRDPAWGHDKMPYKFKVLYGCWKDTELRHKEHTRFFYSVSWKRGWLPITDWNRFRDYALQ